MKRKLVAAMVGAAALAASCGDGAPTKGASAGASAPAAAPTTHAPSEAPITTQPEPPGADAAGGDGDVGADPTPTPLPATRSSPAPARAQAPARVATATPAADRVLASGEFRNRDYEGSGRATIIQKGDGSRILKLDPFSSQSGPSLRVWTSGRPWDAANGAFIADHVDIGPLKSLSGAQTYKLPPGVDPATVRSVVIWCERFQAPFIAAAMS